MAISIAPPKMTVMEVSVECTICRNQDSTLTYVDFDAAADRGFYGDDETTKVPFDDVVICEICLANGASKIGMIDGNSWKSEKSSLEVKVDRLTRERDQAQNYVARLEDAFDHRPEKIKVDHRKKPRELDD